MHTTLPDSSERPDAPYGMSARPPEPTTCPSCRASFQRGRWTWAKAPAAANRQLCPACRRIQDSFPAGYVTVKGAFLRDHHDEIVAFVEAHARKEKCERPLQRLIAISPKGATLEVTTTHSQLARSIAEGLQAQFQGDLKLRYSRDENLLRAVWQR